jgi:hypothetical protein
METIRRTGGLAPHRRIGQQKAAPITGIEDTAP